MTIEVPIQQVFWYRQLNGIALVREEWDRLKQRVKHEKYTAYLELAQVLGMSPSSLNFRNIADHLDGTDAEFLKDYGKSAYLEECFAIAQDESKFAKSFLSYMRARRDENTLIRVGVGEERVYPMFDCFGTVTGRIVVSDPTLQSLHRSHRGIVGADAGKVLLYCDFAQFEPGILASIANDSEFIQAYNTRDLYRELSQYLFANHSQRKEAKRVFLSYIYGMPPGGIARLLCGPTPDENTIEKYKSQIEGFFHRFLGLPSLRQRVLDELQNAGKISSLFGNHRRRTTTDRLTAKEQQWALSQLIQGTASLIFKEALLGIVASLGPESILLPMHDAILMQIAPNEVERARSQVVSIMEAAFLKWCPQINVRVVTEPFASET